jgi:hypothetical protein
MVEDVAWLAQAPRASEARKEEVRQGLRARLEAAGLAVEEHRYSLLGAEGVNLLAGQGAVLVGAHYDSVPESPGADDNASGVAVALEVARLLGPAVTTALFDDEEPQPATLPGDGRNYAFGSEALLRERSGWSAAIIVESVGISCADCQELPRGVSSGLVPVDGEALYLIGLREQREALARATTAARVAMPSGRRAHGVALPGRGEALPQSRWSDHAPFWDRGLLAWMVTDTAVLRNRQYHRAGDQPPLDPLMLEGAARSVVLSAAALTGRCPSEPG